MPYRPFRTRVIALAALTPHLTRVTFAGESLHTFGTGGPDQRVKLLLPLPAAPVADLGAGDWYENWRALPDERRNPMRTFTARAVRPGELDVDFAVHGGSRGPAARWLAGAAVGDPLVVVGPDGADPAIGYDYRPGPASNVLLAGDETALPAIAAILATPGSPRTPALPAPPRTTVLLELGDVRDAAALPATDADVRVLARDPAAPGERLHATLAGWLERHPELAGADAGAPLADVDVDRDLLWETGVGDGGFYAWLAGEAAMITRLRRLLVTEAGVDRRRVAFLGYWRRGRAEQN